MCLNLKEGGKRTKKDQINSGYLNSNYLSYLVSNDDTDLN